MSEKSILLGLDGSAQARYAAELAWSIAKAGKMRVDAQHVIDSLAAWDFLNFDIAGFIGSGPYFEAHESMRETLQELGKELIGAYSASAEQNGVVSEAFLDEGTTIREIANRAKNYDLVVLGQRGTGMQSPHEDKRKLPRRSIAESLTHYCPKPLIVVGDRGRPWNSMRILLGSTPVPPDQIAHALEFAKTLKLEPSVRYLYECATPAAEKKAKSEGEKAAEQLANEVPELKGVTVETQTVKDIADHLQIDADLNESTLLVVPVVELESGRRTAFGWAPDVVVRYLSHPAVLFWMEFAASGAATEVAEGASTTA